MFYASNFSPLWFPFMYFIGDNKFLGSIPSELELLTSLWSLADWADCSIYSPCANTKFCNYDAGVTGFCEDCPANASCCSKMGLPVNGAGDCKYVCSINDEEEDKAECEVGGDYNYTNALDLPENETGIEI